MELASNIASAAKSMFKAVVNEMHNGIGELKAMVQNGLSETKQVVKAVFDEIVDEGQGKIKAITEIFDWLRAAGKSKIDAIKEIKSDILDANKASFSDVWSGIKEKIGDGCDLIKDMKAAGITESKLTSIATTIGDLACSARCIRKAIPSSRFCGTVAGIDLCKERKTFSFFRTEFNICIRFW